MTEENNMGKIKFTCYRYWLCKSRGIGEFIKRFDRFP